MRQAVYRADCQAQGHQFDFAHVIAVADEPGPTGRPLPTLAARDPDLLPHVTCTRCQHVWLVIDTEGVDYADAVEQVSSRLGGVPTGRLRPRPRPERPDRPTTRP